MRARGAATGVSAAILTALAVRRARRRARGRAWRVRIDHEASADSARIHEGHEGHTADAPVWSPTET